MALFDANYSRLRRVVARLSGEAELASDLVQEAFVRLYRRGAMPETPEAWLISVAMNLLRNEKTKRARRLRLLAAEGGAPAMGAPETPMDENALRVRSALERLPEREAQMLLLQAEGYGYRDIAAALELNESSVGTLMSRARQALRRHYEDLDAPG